MKLKILLILLLFPFISLAQNPLDFVSTYCDINDPELAISYCLQGLYNLGVALAVMLAFFMFLFGAFKNLLSVVPDVKMEGKSMMRNSIIGLVVIFVSGSILYWINPFIFDPRIVVYRITTDIDHQEKWTDNDVANIGYNSSNYQAPGKTGKIVKIKPYSNIRLSNNDEYQGQTGEFANECVLPFLEKLNENLKKYDVKVTLTDGFSVGDHESEAHIKYGTAVDIVPLFNRKEYWEKVCKAAIETGMVKKIFYEAGSWENLNCGNVILQRYYFNKTTGGHFHIETCK
ncbi:MAG: hypothetical protein KatS3mg094_599 [Candidatus Parcubacteria bacterium]|nr:MAG: hypothetical protein KatS3mg094_599 [Candidatus Parcubacteria bacterium]